MSKANQKRKGDSRPQAHQVAEDENEYENQSYNHHQRHLNQGDDDDNDMELQDEEAVETVPPRKRPVEIDSMGYAPSAAAAGAYPQNFPYAVGGVRGGPAGVAINSQNQMMFTQQPNPIPQHPQTRVRPQSAKTADEQQLKFQQQAFQGQPVHWMGNQTPVNGIPEQYSYQMQQQQPGVPIIGGFTVPYGQGFMPPGSNMLAKKRPTSSYKRNNLNFGGGSNGAAKKALGSKNPSTIELEVSKMRPRVIHQERERLYDDAMKQKITANFLKDENMKLKTKIQILEGEMSKKEKLIDDLLLQQDSFQPQSVNNASNGLGGGIPMNIKTGLSKLKLESHLSANLKRKIKELQGLLAQKSDEVELLRKNIKSTKLSEFEVEMKMYMDECTRLRHQLEEVIKSKDTFADPAELKLIEDKFQAQEQLINKLKTENTELAMIYSQKEDENRKILEIMGDMERKQKKAQVSGKETSKLKKVIKERDKELNKAKVEVQQQKQLVAEYQSKIEELVKKQPFNSRPQTAGFSQPAPQSQLGNMPQSEEVKQLRQEKDRIDGRNKELNTVVQSLQQKLQEKVGELAKETEDKMKYKGLYEQYQEEVARLQAQIEIGAPIQASKPKQAPPAAQMQKQNEEPVKKDKAEDPPSTKAPEQKKADPVKQEKKVKKVEEGQIQDVFLELKLKLQMKGFYIHQMKDFFFKPYQEDQQTSIKVLKDIFECNGIHHQKALLLSRYLIEPKKQAEIPYNEERSATQKEVIEALQSKIGHYPLYNDSNQLKKFQDRLQKIFAPCKNTLKDTIQLEDIDEIGCVPLAALKESFETLEIEVEEDLMDYIVYVVYQKSESLEKMKYQALFDLIEGKLLQGQLSQGSEGAQSRKRPESSSPEKLKARNKEKFTAASQPTEQDKRKSDKHKDEEEEDDEDNYEQEFENLLDKDEGEEGSKKEEGEEDGAGMDEGEEEYIDEEQMLDIAEGCFVKIAEAIIQKGINVRKAFSKFIIKEDIEGQLLELLSPIGFLEGIKDLGVTELEEVEVACLMRVLTKADLENAILLRELVVIMENFGIKEDEDDGAVSGGGPRSAQDGHDDDGGLAKEQDSQQNYDQQLDHDDIHQQQQQPKKKGGKKKGGAKPTDLTQLDEKSIKILAKLMLALMELNMSLAEFFEGSIYEQLVKTKTKQNRVEIINTKDFFDILQARGVRKSNKEHDNLMKVLQLDPNYPNLIMMKKLTKTLDEMAKNEELMAGILAAAVGEQEGEGDGIGAGGEVIVEDQFEGDGSTQQQRLITIGEDGEEDKNFDTNKDHSKGYPVGKMHKAAMDDEEEEGDYEEQEFEEPDDDYAF